MFQKKTLRMIALIAATVLCLGMLASCTSNSDDGLNGVTGSVGGNLSIGNKQENAGNQQDNTVNNNENNAGSEQLGTETPGGNGQGGTEDPDTPVTNAPEGGEEENDPYAKMKADKTGTPLKILCQNLRLNSKQEWGSDNDIKIRRYRFQWLMDKYDPDILCGQEADSSWISILQEDYSSEYEMFYEYRGNTTGSNEACPVLWKKDKYTKLKDGYFWLSDTPGVSSPSYVGGLPRIVNWVSLKDKQTGQEFYIYSTHFSLDLKPEHMTKTRTLIAEHFAKVSNDAYAFIMGDFNISYMSDQYYELVDGVTLADLRPISEEMAANGHCELGDIRKGAYNGFTEDDGGVFGDFIMTLPRKHLAVDFFGYCYEKPAVPEQGVGPGFVSDHFAVYTEVRVGSELSYTEYFGDNAK